MPGLKDELKVHVGKAIGSFAKPDEIRFTDALPKTRSGKIMRRLLRDLASGVSDGWRHDDPGRFFGTGQTAGGRGIGKAARPSGRRALTGA